MDNGATYQDVSEMMDKIPKDYCILEEEIDIDIHIEYQNMIFHLVKKEEYKTLKDKPIEENYEHLLNLIKEDSLEINNENDIKKMIVFLSHSGATRSYDLLKQLEPLLATDPLKSWLKIALLDCKIYLENQLLGTNKHIVITGLGGKGKQLRYNIVGLIDEGAVLSDFHKDTIEKEFNYTALQNDCEIESIAFYEKCIVLLALVPLKVSLEKLIASVVKECHLLGVPLKKEYLVTNVKQLSEEEIADFIEHKELGDTETQALKSEDSDE